MYHSLSFRKDNRGNKRALTIGSGDVILVAETQMPIHNSLNGSLELSKKFVVFELHLEYHYLSAITGP